MRKIKLDQTGETIVEVLIATAVLGLVLSASYALASRSTQITQASHERAEALKIGEQQAERLQQDISSGVQPPNCYRPNGEKEFSGPCWFPPENRYRVSIRFNPNRNTYRIVTEWDRVGGGSDELVMYYRDDPETITPPSAPEPTPPPAPTPPPTPPPTPAPTLPPEPDDPFFKVF